MFKRKKEKVRVCPYRYDLGMNVYFKYEERTGPYYYNKETRIRFWTIVQIVLDPGSKAGDIEISYNIKFYDKSGEMHYESANEDSIYLNREALLNSLDTNDMCDVFNDSKLFQKDE